MCEVSASYTAMNKAAMQEAEMQDYILNLQEIKHFCNYSSFIITPYCCSFGIEKLYLSILTNL